jgi:hypothetical protein
MLKNKANVFYHCIFFYKAILIAYRDENEQYNPLPGGWIWIDAAIVAQNCPSMLNFVGNVAV